MRDTFLGLSFRHAIAVAENIVRFWPSEMGDMECGRDGVMSVIPAEAGIQGLDPGSSPG